mmetsp:Transcript_13073/g.15868  ORF Transcript_13073/g.15868 Transcript_13073/m.15868 type:complete len:273 (-) Transcript_13073:488-1306(-)
MKTVSELGVISTQGLELQEGGQDWLHYSANQLRHSRKNVSRNNSVLVCNSWALPTVCEGSGVLSPKKENGAQSNMRPRAFSLGAHPQKCECGKEWIDNSRVPLLRSNSYDSNVDMEDMMTKHIDTWKEEELVAELVEGTPKVLLKSYSQNVDEIELHSKSPCGEERCRICGRSNCLMVEPRVGFYRQDQVEKHCRPDDCWIIAHGIVYDVTRYIAKHPGGAQSILRRAGQDCSNDFDFHSSYSKKKLWRRHQIGRLSYCDGSPTNEEACIIC